MLVACKWRWCTRDLGLLCRLELEGEGYLFYLPYPLIMHSILDILMLQVTRQQLGLLIRGWEWVGNPKVKNALSNVLSQNLCCHIQPCPILGAARGTIPSVDRGTIPDAGRGTILDAGRGTILDAGRGTILGAGRGTILGLRGTILGLRGTILAKAPSWLLRSTGYFFTCDRL